MGHMVIPKQLSNLTARSRQHLLEIKNDSYQFYFLSLSEKNSVQIYKNDNKLMTHWQICAKTIKWMDEGVRSESGSSCYKIIGVNEKNFVITWTCPCKRTSCKNSGKLYAMPKCRSNRYLKSFLLSIFKQLNSKWKVRVCVSRVWL